MQSEPVHAHAHEHAHDHDEHNHDHAHHAHAHDHDHQHDHETPGTLQAWLKVALLLGLGAYFTYNILSGNLTNYINARFAWLSYVAAALFFALGAASAIGLLRGEAHDHAHDDHDHEHEAITWPVMVVIAMPLILGTLVPSQPLGANAIDANFQPDAGAVVGAEESIQVGSDPLTWNVLDWLRAINRSDDLASFAGQEAEILGFVYHNDQYPEDTMLVSRFVISCCVADASPIGLPVYLEGAQADYAVDSWVQVRGAFEIGPFGGNDVPILHAQAVEVVDVPEHPYLYP